MCEVNAYLLRKDGREELLMEKVYLIEPEGDRIRIENLFGEQKLLPYKIHKIDLPSYKIFFKE